MTVLSRKGQEGYNALVDLYKELRPGGRMPILADSIPRNREQLRGVKHEIRRNLNRFDKLESDFLHVLFPTDLEENDHILGMLGVDLSYSEIYEVSRKNWENAVKDYRRDRLNRKTKWAYPDANYFTEMYGPVEEEMTEPIYKGTKLESTINSIRSINGIFWLFIHNQL